jgi:transglutaminase-like putative cysteine protease
MAEKSISAFRAAGIVAGVVFLGLLLARMGVFEWLGSRPKPLAAAAVAGARERNTWMNVFQNNRKIGYAHTRFHAIDGGFGLEDTLLMRINAMGMVQEIRLRTQARLHPDLTIDRLDFVLDSGRFRFGVRGTVAGDTLSVVTETAGDRRRIEIPLERRPHPAAALIDALSAADLRAGARYTFDVFDPTSLAPVSVQAEVIGREDIQVLGAGVPATRVALSFRGMVQTAWIGDDGELLRERGLLGMRLEKTTRAQAVAGLEGAAGPDVAELAAVTPSRPLTGSADLAQLKVRIGGIAADGLQLAGGRQTFSGDILTVRRETLDDLADELRPQDLPGLERVFLRAEPLIQSDHARIRAQVASILGENPQMPAVLKVRRLMEWVERHIEKRPVLSLPDALSTLENRMGDCNEHAVLFAALARAAGIPTRVEAGLVHLRGKFYYHAWNLVYLGRWITLDALFGQLPADVTHLRFVTGSVNQQLDLIGVIGKLTLDIID